MRRAQIPEESNLSGVVQAITAGGAHSCAIASGATTCWGLNNNGQLGNATPGNFVEGGGGGGGCAVTWSQRYICQLNIVNASPMSAPSDACSCAQ